MSLAFLGSLEKAPLDPAGKGVSQGQRTSHGLAVTNSASDGLPGTPAPERAERKLREAGSATNQPECPHCVLK